MADLGDRPCSQAPTNFLMLSVGRPRPGKRSPCRLRMISRELDGVPAVKLTRVKAMNLARAEDLTHYDEGCPSNVLADAFGLQGVFGSQRSQHLDARPVLPGASSAPTTQCRSLAPLWRPYTTDNIAGPTWAREIFADKLAAHLAEKYGADPQVVQQKYRLAHL
jgi:hypothetical protein